MKKLLSFFAIVTFVCAGHSLHAQDATKTVATLASESKDHSTLGTAMKTSTLDKTWGEEGPYTVFAPTDAAFNKISKDSLDKFYISAKEKDLKNSLNYLVLKGQIDLYQLAQAIKSDEDGQAELETVNGAIITASMDKDRIKLTDERGVVAYVDPKVEWKATNGVVLSIDTVLMPK